MDSARILIVEDEKLVADDLQETLQGLGYEVSASVASGEEALAKIAEAVPDLVLMDIRLAGVLDGVQTSDLIQSQFQIPIVYLTANADCTTLERVKASQPFGYILKPFDEKILATTIDIALSRHQAEKEMRQALSTTEVELQNIKQKAQKQSEHISILAHELRNPVTTIKFAIEMLMNHNVNLPEDKRERYIERIQNATKSLNNLLEDVLTLERTRVNKLQCLPIPIEFVSFCREVLETFQLSSGDLYSFVFSSNESYCLVYLDDKLLWHLLNNLLSNAVKYSPKGGNIWLTITFTAETINLQVKDQGIGIPAEAQTTLFEPFQRASNVGKIPGSGLGLAIAKQCVTLQGGTITVESAVGAGATFTVILPRQNASYPLLAKKQK
ncbi:hybrid sensor histidine kinase/response regulator [Leptodesmis sp.]|uniref:hybrid sensor histidine kinase/response regulator n=1 Tax=Leptodesmis sp. TaxID=3100501 RepID=UPI00405359BA